MAESVSKPHTLVIVELEEIDSEGCPYREWEVVHHEDCPKIVIENDLDGTPVEDYDCMVGREIQYNGIDFLWPEWTTLAAGEFQFEAYSSYDPYNMEYDGGLRLIGEDD